MQQRPRPAYSGDFSVKRATTAHYRAFAACRLLGRRQDAGSAVHVSRHGQPGATLDHGRGGDHDLAVPPEQRPRHRRGRSRADQARRAAVAGDGGPQQDGPQCEGPAGQAARAPPAIPPSWRSKTYRPATTPWRKPSPAGATRRRTRPTCSKTVSQNWASRRLMLQTPNTRCSGRSSLHQPEAGPVTGFDASQGGKLGVILASISPIDAVANCRHGAVSAH